MNAMKTDLYPGPTDTLIYEQLVILPTLIEQAHEQGRSHAKIAAAPVGLDVTDERVYA